MNNEEAIIIINTRQKKMIKLLESIAIKQVNLEKRIMIIENIISKKRIT